MKDASEEKLRGGFYTPPQVAKFILKWAVNGNKSWDILEPSCGDGIFLKQIKENKIKHNSVTAVELFKEEADKARKIGLKNSNIITGDFFNYCNNTEDRFDLIVGNPPFIRYQYFDKSQRNEAEKLFQRAGLKYSKLTNAWVSFIVGSSLLLKDTGKIGFVLPAEILQVGYAKQLRIFLAHYYNKINIVSFKKLIFIDNNGNGSKKLQQEVVLLLCEKTGEKTHLIEHLEVKDIEELTKLDVTRLKSPKKKIDFKSNKWTFYFLEQDEIDFIERLLSQKQIQTIRKYATVQVGMTTGFNKFFTVPLSIVKEYNLKKYMHPMVGRSVQVSSVIFTDEDWKKNVKSDARANFLLFPTLSKLSTNKKATDYIKEGENLGIHEGYKCGMREEWHIVPSAWVSQALFIRRNNIYPRLIVNQAEAYTTDTMHRVTVKGDYDLNAFVSSYYNSLSFAFAEICGRSHGGGVLELMPNEVEDILIPYKKENAHLLETIDSMLREKKSIHEILKYTDNIILKDGFGFSDKDIEIANRIWKKLLNRRLQRGKPN